MTDLPRHKANGRRSSDGTAGRLGASTSGAAWPGKGYSAVPAHGVSKEATPVEGSVLERFLAALATPLPRPWEAPVRRRVTHCIAAKRILEVVT